MLEPAHRGGRQPVPAAFIPWKYRLVEKYHPPAETSEGDSGGGAGRAGADNGDIAGVVGHRYMVAAAGGECQAGTLTPAIRGWPLPPSRRRSYYQRRQLAGMCEMSAVIGA